VIVNDGTAGGFLASIALDELERSDDEVVFGGRAQYAPWPKAYGGDTVAQALAAATATVDADRSMHSFHAYFVRPVEIDEPTWHLVGLQRDGRGFSTRTVRSEQDGRETFSAIVSFAVDQGDDRFAAPPALPLGDPEALPSAAQVLADAGTTGPAAEYWSAGRSFDHRHDPSPVYLETAGSPGSQVVWIRALSPIPADARTQQLALAYVCDYTILEPALRVHGLHWSEPGLVTASLDHSMWFHRPVDLNEWVAYVQEPVSVQGGRGLCSGRFYSRDGRLVATVMQEGMIRRPATPVDAATPETKEHHVD
jgi:acyl-CoA thioesterase-2